MTLRPKDAAVFNTDGSFNHVIEFPDSVEHNFTGRIERFKIDDFTDLKLENNKIVIGVRFAHNWF